MEWGSHPQFFYDFLLNSGPNQHTPTNLGLSRKLTSFPKKQLNFHENENMPYKDQNNLICIFIGPRCPLGPIYGSGCLSLTNSLQDLFANLTDATLAVLTKYIEWTLRILGNNFAMLVHSSIDVFCCSATKFYSQFNWSVIVIHKLLLDDEL